MLAYMCLVALSIRAGTLYGLSCSEFSRARSSHTSFCLMVSIACRFGHSTCTHSMLFLKAWIRCNVPGNLIMFGSRYVVIA